MFLKSAQAPNGQWMIIAIDNPNNKRLKGTCFRGPDVHRAGNLLIVKNVQQLVAQNKIIQPLVAKCVHAVRDISQDEEIDQGFTIELDHFVGWSSTVPREGWLDEELETFKPGKNARGLRVKRTSERRAPLTTLVTIVCTLKYDDAKEQWVAIIRSIYPGKDIGELKGDVTARENIVFFDWLHPGEPLPPSFT